MLNTDYKPKGNVFVKTKEITLSYGIKIIFQIPIRKNSKFKVPVIVSHQLSNSSHIGVIKREEPWQTHPHHWGRWVWMFACVKHTVINRKLNTSLNKISVFRVNRLVKLNEFFHLLQTWKLQIL